MPKEAVAYINWEATTVRGSLTLSLDKDDIIVRVKNGKKFGEKLMGQLTIGKKGVQWHKGNKPVKELDWDALIQKLET